MASKKMIERRRVHFSGQVQGVGFRYTAVSVARSRHAGITGYVQNLSDGRVVVVAEGEKEALERFLADLSDTMSGYVRDVQSETGPPTGEYKGFGVRF